MTRYCRHTAGEVCAADSDECQRCNSVAEAEAGGRARQGRQGDRAVGMQGGGREGRKKRGGKEGGQVKGRGRAG